MNKMNRIIALILTVVMLIGTLMLEAGAAAAVDIIYEEDENGKPTDIIDYEKTVAQYLTLEFETPQQKLATMTKMVERDGYQLWVDDFTGEGFIVLRLENVAVFAAFNHICNAAHIG